MPLTPHPPLEPAPSDAKPRLGFWDALALVTAACGFAAAMILTVWLQFDDLLSVRQKMIALAPWTTLWRLTLIVSVVALWRPMVERLARTRKAHPSERAHWLRLRWPAGALLLAMELLIVQDGFGRVIRWALNA